jgi:histidinol phosphatase-like enzyme
MFLRIIHNLSLFKCLLQEQLKSQSEDIDSCKLCYNHPEDRECKVLRNVGVYF